ncbi:primosomal protein N' [soil metagenome]
MPSARVARVMIDLALPQLDRLFDYRIPPELVDVALPGVRVRVPLRRAGRIADGFLVELAEPGDFTGMLSDLDSVVSPVRVLAPEVWTLARRVADRAGGAASDVVRLAVPKRQVRVEKAWSAVTPAEPAPVAEATADSYPTLGARVAAAELLAVEVVPRLVDVGGEWVGHWSITLAAAASAAVAGGGSAILAVPDHRDQEQLLIALSAIIPKDRIVHLDARQSNPDRYRALLQCLGDQPLVVVGNRSVVYAPAAHLGLIALWDDGDPLHVEPLAPYVHSRDVALLRQQQQGGALIFLGHTRSTDVERLVELGWLGSLSPDRTWSPKVVPTAQQISQDRLAAQARIPSSAWREARAALEHGPVLVQVARPGYAPRLACQDCAESARCAACEGPLRLASSAAVPSCAFCGAIATDWRCRTCGSGRYRVVGHAAGRTAEELGRAFPGVRVIIADGQRQVLRIDSAPALVVATRGAEPIPAGGYRAVLLLDGERMLARESLRVAEDCLRWWSNAIALAAPGATSMLVGVGGAIASALATWRLADYARSELADRRLLRFPPAVRVATVTGDADSVERAIASVTADDRVDVLGPVPTEGGGLRAIVRFDYAAGAAVASALRAELIRNASSRRRRIAGQPRPALPTLRVRFDDADPFDQ